MAATGHLPAGDREHIQHLRRFASQHLRDRLLGGGKILSPAEAVWNRAAISAAAVQRHVLAPLRAAGFDALVDEAAPWDPILDYMDYRRELKGDVFGRMFYVRRGQTRLRHNPPAT